MFINKLKLFYASFLLLLLGLILFFVKNNFESFQLHEDTIIFGINGNCLPFAVLDNKGEWRGFEIDVISHVANKLKKKIIFKKIDMQFLFSALENNTIDLVGASLAITKRRLDEMSIVHVYGKPHPDVAVMFWQEKNIPVGLSIDDVKKLSQIKPIGALEGSVWEEILEENGVRNIKAVENEHDLLLMLKFGKIAAAIIYPRGGEYFAQQNSEIKLVKVTLDKPWGFGAGIGIKKDRKELQAQVQKAVDELKQEGIIRQLQIKWFGGCDDDHA